MKNLRFIAPFAFALVLVADAAFATPALTNFQVSDAAGISVKAGKSSVAHNTTDRNSLAVWEQFFPVTGGQEGRIFGQLIGVDGTKIGLPFQMSLGDATRPDVAYDSVENEYLVVFERGNRIEALSVSAAGDTIGFEIQISDPRGSVANPAVAFNRNASMLGIFEYLVVYENDLSQTTADVDIWGQRVTVDVFGPFRRGVPFQISQMSNPATNRTAFAPAVVWNSANSEYLVTWTSDGGPADNVFEIYGQRVSSLGGEVGTNDFQISQMNSAGSDRDGFDSALAYNPTDDVFYTVWTGDGAGLDTTMALAAGDYETFGQVTAANDTVVSDDNQVSNMRASGAGRVAYRPTVVHNSLENVYVSFYEGDGAPFVDNDFEIFARRISAAGAAISPEVPLSLMHLAGTGRDARSAAAVYSSGLIQYLLIWDGDGGSQPNNDDEVFGHASSLEQVPVFFVGIDAVVVDNAVVLRWRVFADEPVMGFRVYRTDEGASNEVRIADHQELAADARQYTDRDVQMGATYRYVLSAVRPDGTEIRSPGTRVTLAPIVFSLQQNFPNPFNPVTTIAYDLASAGRVSLVVYDVTGREIVRLVNERKPAGVYSVAWDGRNSRQQSVASGTYFYKITVIPDQGRAFSSVRKLVLTK